MKDEIDIYETTPTRLRRLPLAADEYEVPSGDGKWIYVMRTNKRGDQFTVYRYPKPAKP